MNKFWTPHLDNLMRRHYPKGDLDELAARIGVTRTAIKSRAKVLGLKRKVNLRRPWTERQLGILRRHYATMPPEWLEEKTRHSRCCIEKKAHALGLHKSHEYRSEAAQRPGFIATRFKKGGAGVQQGAPSGGLHVIRGSGALQDRALQARSEAEQCAPRGL